jgi:metallo-beta-lactamase class B
MSIASHVKPFTSSWAQRFRRSGDGKKPRTWSAIAPLLLAACLSASCAIVNHFTGEDVNKELRARGLPAVAKVLSVEDAGLRVNDDPVVILKLEVQAEGRAPWRAEAKQLVSIIAIPAIQPGSMLAVHYDPANPSRVAVDLQTEGTVPATLPKGPVDLGRDLTLEPVGDGVWVYRAIGEVAGFGEVPANGLVVVGGAEAALVNATWTDDQATRIIAWLASHGQVRVTSVVVTHSHEDCLGGLGALHRAGARSYALARTAELAGRDHRVVPQVLFTDRLSFPLGGRTLELRYLGPGHAPDNVVVWLPDARVLFGGCLVREASATSLGNTADADLVSWPGTVAALQQAYPDVVTVVPGHGRPGGRELLQHTLDVLAASPK